MDGEQIAVIVLVGILIILREVINDWKVNLDDERQRARQAALEEAIGHCNAFCVKGCADRIRRLKGE